MRPHCADEVRFSRRALLAAAAVGAGGVALGGFESQTRAAAASARSYAVPLDSVHHTRTWMAWPDSTAIWGRALPAVQADIATVARTIAKYEPVFLCANAGSVEAARAACGPTVTVLGSIPVNDCWMRDMGPIFRTNGHGGLDAVGLNFNGWGGKQIHARDALVAQRVAARLGIPFTAAGLVSEGGAIETDGNHTLMATRSSIINPNRNPGMTQDQIEAAMCTAYGASKVIWFKGITGKDITDDHVDSTSRFTGDACGIVQYPARSRDMNIWSKDERQQYQVLSSSTAADGTPVAVTKLIGPIWSKIRQHNHNDFVDAYANYYVCNGAVISAQFGDAEADAAAAVTLAQVFPGRVIEQLNIDNLGNGGGGVHCVTQPQPVVSRRASRRSG